ncbi:hypothetical protein N9I31_07190 [Candidatus Pseudothioglobus singularis]|nr:hypothetical protein [Candidatus Pseudothioglobus singularis]
MFDNLFKTDRWYLLSTKSRSENIANDNLNFQGHETFLPTITPNKKRIALFPGYIFIKPKAGSSYISIKSTKGVNKFIKFKNTFPGVPENLIEFLRSSINDFEMLAKNNTRYKKGQLVNIESGPFKDFEAIFDTYDKDSNVFILLKFIERTQRIKIKESDLY